MREQLIPRRRRRVLAAQTLILALLHVAGCAPSQYPEPDMPGAKTPKPERSFSPGPTLADSAALLAWLESNPSAYLRLPVVVFRGGLGGVELAFIGSDPVPPGDDAILLELDDSALGIGLSTRLRSLCGGSDACAVWIEGTWGRLLPGIAAPAAAEPPPWPLAVRDAGPRVEGSPATILVADRGGPGDSGGKKR